MFVRLELARKLVGIGGLFSYAMDDFDSGFRVCADSDASPRSSALNPVRSCISKDWRAVPGAKGAHYRSMRRIPRKWHARTRLGHIVVICLPWWASRLAHAPSLRLSGVSFSGRGR